MSPEARTCKQCGETFTCAPSRKQEHCGDICSRKTQAITRTKHHTTECVICKKTFQIKNISQINKTCSKECLSKLVKGRPPPNKFPREIIKCAYCGEGFEVPQGNNTSRKYCGRECQNKARIGTSPTNKGEWIDKVCLSCGETYSIPIIRKDTAKFCSHRCGSDWKTRTTGKDHPLYTLVDRECEWCGEPFTAKPAKIAMGEGRLCSNECVGAYSTSLQGGRVSSIERHIGTLLKALGVVCEPQKRLGRWSVDFYLPEYNLVIECDGDYWHSLEKQIDRDKRKDKWLKENGYNLLRLTETEINTDDDDKLELKILQKVIA